MGSTSSWAACRRTSVCDAAGRFKWVPAVLLTHVTRLLAFGASMLVWLSLLAFAVGLGRAFLDLGVVYPEVGLMTNPGSVFATMAALFVIYGAWAWALIPMAGARRLGLWVALVITLLASVGLGLGTTLAFCPTPCQTLWPIAEIWNWATTLTGVAAVVVQLRALRARA